LPAHASASECLHRPAEQAFDRRAQQRERDGNNDRDIYLRDRRAHKTRRVSVKTNNQGVTGYGHQLPAISRDVRWVAFSSQGKFTGGDSGVDFDVFERGPLH